MFTSKEDVEEKIEYPFGHDAAYIANRDPVPLVRQGEIYLWRWFVKRESAFLTEELAAVDFAFRKGFIKSVIREGTARPCTCQLEFAN